MSASESRVCASCGMRAKPRWEICPRCGEPLVGALQATGDTVRRPVPASGPAVDADGWDWRDVAFTLGLLAVGVLAWQTFRVPPAEAAPFMTLPSVPPSAPPFVEVPGAPAGIDAFAEANRLLAKGDAEGSLPLFEQALALTPGNAGYRAAYAKALWQAGRREQAIDQFAEVARARPESAAAWADLGLAQMTLGRDADARPSLEQAARLAPGDAAVARDLGTLLVRQGETRRAAELLAPLVGRGGNLAFEEDLAYQIESAGDAATAASLYRTILDGTPQASTSRSRLAQMLVKEGRTAEALGLVEQGIQMTPGVPVLHRSLGSLLEQAGRPAEAAAAYRDYVRLAPNDPDSAVLLERAQLLERSPAPPSAAAGPTPPSS